MVKKAEKTILWCLKVGVKNGDYKGLFSCSPVLTNFNYSGFIPPFISSEIKDEY